MKEEKIKNHNLQGNKGLELKQYQERATELQRRCEELEH
jgi:hypothetical protein